MDLTPTITAAPGEYLIKWPFPDVLVEFEAGRLRTHSDGKVQATVKVFATVPGKDREKYHHETMNLSAGQTRRRLSQTLEERLPRDNINWDQVIEKSCTMILDREEQGSPTRRLQPVAGVDVKYMLGKVVLDSLPILSFAPGGQFKSFLAIYKALLIENGLPFQDTDTMQANTLILDWEVTESEAARRCTMLANGLGQSYIGYDIRFPLYRHCIGPLSDEASEIARVVATNNIRFLVIDSAGLACGGDVASSELTMQFFTTLRKVTASTGAAVDIQTHTTKSDRRDENTRRLPIGSIYWENLSRITWEVRSERERPGVHRVGLFPRKCNTGDLEPVGLRMTFDRDALVVEAAAANDVSTEAGVLQALIVAELERGPARVADLMEATGATDSAVRTALTRLKHDHRAHNPERGVWHLAGEGEAA
ncbi:MAG: AAA family ATPase [Armatimonadetes bacterium]|nr:AAA family ATPase [Armatimonadota bacterium]